MIFLGLATIVLPISPTECINYFQEAGFASTCNDLNPPLTRRWFFQASYHPSFRDSRPHFDPDIQLNPDHAAIDYHLVQLMELRYRPKFHEPGYYPRSERSTWSGLLGVGSYVRSRCSLGAVPSVMTFRRDPQDDRVRGTAILYLTV
jgi:hypothetical protein